MALQLGYVCPCSLANTVPISLNLSNIATRAELEKIGICVLGKIFCICKRNMCLKKKEKKIVQKKGKVGSAISFLVTKVDLQNLMSQLSCLPIRCNAKTIFIKRLFPPNCVQIGICLVRLLQHHGFH
jgi:hypothetical protein